MYTLYSYFRSSAAYRVRIALNLKQLSYETIPVHLTRNGGEQHTQSYLQHNPQHLVPSLNIDGTDLTQSLAIIEYLEETHPTPALLPEDPILRAKVRAMAQIVASDIHPLNNLRVLQYLTKTLEHSAEAKMQWYHHWLQSGFAAIETLLQQRDNSTPFCLTQTASLADVCLIPQVYNALRFDLPMTPYPNIQKIYDACLKLDAFAAATPEQQPDAE